VTRPVFLNLSKMKFPPMAIVSILHRITGVVIFLGLPLALYLLDQSLQSPARFLDIQAFLAIPLIKFTAWVLLIAVAYHFLAGLRHMIMDCGFGEHLRTARITAYLIICVSMMAAIFLGVWLW